jgi:hypothetical protein
MILLTDEIVSDHQLLQILVRHLQFLTNDETLPDRQLWGATSANSEGCWFNSIVTQRRRPAGGIAIPSADITSRLPGCTNLGR